jgi:hypothetical protein
MICSSNVSDKNKGYGMLLECLRQKQGVWYTLWKSQTEKSVMVYSSNVSEKNKGYGILLEIIKEKQGVWYTPQSVRQK